MRLKRTLGQAEPMEELDEEILKNAVSSAKADSNGRIILTLKNGQEYKGSESHE